MKRRTFDRILWGAIWAVVLLLAALCMHFALHRYYNARYPLKYQQVLEASAEENGLPPSLLFAVAHTESGFDPEAVSAVDARGLMQITRDTFDWIQHKMGLEEPLDYDRYATDPAVSARYGAYLLRLLYDEFGSYELALCAYHAGRGNLLKWLRDPELSADGESLTHIPFSDTRWYVDRVLETQKSYQQLYQLE